VSHQVEVVIFSMVGGQVEGVLRVAIFVVVARDVDAFVPVQLART